MASEQSALSSDPGEPRFTHPFNDTTADLTIRCSDGNQFRAHKSILAAASPVFADMFALPPVNTISCGEVDMVESSETIEWLLRACYSMANPDLGGIESITELATAADKLEMTLAQKCIIKSLKLLLDTDALRVYAISQRAKLRGLTREAARRCLYFPSTYLQRSTPSADCKLMTADQHNELIHLHARTTASAYTIIARHKCPSPEEVLSPRLTLLCGPGRRSAWLNCGKCRPKLFEDRPLVKKESTYGFLPTRIIPTFVPKRWWEDLLTDVEGDVGRNGPLGFVGTADPTDKRPSTRFLHLYSKRFGELGLNCPDCEASALEELQFRLCVIEKEIAATEGYNDSGSQEVWSPCPTSFRANGLTTIRACKG